jgi:hypothetical protein
MKVNWLIRLALLALAVIIPLILFDVYLAHFMPQKTTVDLISGPQLQQFDPLVGYRYASNITVRMRHPEFEDQRQSNEWGFLDGNLGNDGRVRVMVLGDSFVEGWQTKVPDRITEQAASGLPDVQFVNLGVGGYNNCQELSVFREFKDAVQPDFIALFLFLGNDITENAEHSTSVPSCTLDNGGVVVHPAQEHAPSKGSGIFDSHLWYFFTNTLKYNPLWLKLAQKVSDKAIVRSLPYYEANLTPEAAQDMQLTGAILRTLADEANGTPVVVFLIPDHFMGSRSAHDYIEQRYDIDLDAYDISLPATRIQEAAGGRITVIDLTPELRKRWNATETYFPENRHLTVAGNGIAADALVASVKEHFGIP